jgi:hypothetical protein
VTVVSDSSDSDSSEIDSSDSDSKVLNDHIFTQKF